MAEAASRSLEGKDAVYSLSSGFLGGRNMGPRQPWLLLGGVGACFPWELPVLTVEGPYLAFPSASPWTQPAPKDLCQASP